MRGQLMSNPRWNIYSQQAIATCSKLGCSPTMIGRTTAKCRPRQTVRLSDNGMAYTLGPVLRTPTIKNLGRDFAPEELRTSPINTGPRV